jgi:hypothetical protein
MSSGQSGHLAKLIGIAERAYREAMNRLLELDLVVEDEDRWGHTLDNSPVMPKCMCVQPLGHSHRNSPISQQEARH